MRARPFLLPIIFCLIQSTVLCQTGRAPASPAVTVPREIAIPVIASQPDSPLQFQDVCLLQAVTGGSIVKFKLRNYSKKPIRSTQFAVWTSEGNGAIDSWSGKSTNQVVAPGDVVPYSANEKYEIVPLTDELREKLKLNGPMKVIIFFMVVRAEFADGSVYSDEPAFSALERYFDELNGFSSRDSTRVPTSRSMSPLSHNRY